MTEQSTTRQRLARTLGRRGMFAALITAAGVWAVLLVQSLLLTALGVVNAAAFLLGTADAANAVGGWSASLLQELLGASVITAIPFAAGVFLSLWQLLPIAPELRFAHVVTRSIVAAVVGGMLALAVGVVVGIVRGLSGVPFMGDVAGGISRAGTEIWQSVLTAAVGALNALVLDLPLVVLAGLLLWGWLQRHPPRHDVAGAIDEI